MTAQDIELIETLAREVVTQGLWEYGATVAQSDEAHIADTVHALAETRKHFEMDGDQKMYSVFVPGSDVKLCITGTSPTSAKRAEFIALNSPQNVLAMCEYITELRGHVPEELYQNLRDDVARLEKARDEYKEELAELKVRQFFPEAWRAPYSGWIWMWEPQDEQEWRPECLSTISWSNALEHSFITARQLGISRAAMPAEIRRLRDLLPSNLEGL